MRRNDLLRLVVVNPKPGCFAMPKAGCRQQSRAIHGLAAMHHYIGNLIGTVKNMLPPMLAG